ELGEILDRVDVVMRRRRDQLDPGLRVPEARNLRRHLVCRRLSAFPGLRTLGDLDLQLVGESEVLGCDAETAGCDLLDARVRLGPEAGGILAALARVRPSAEPVECNRDRLVCLYGEGAVRHGTDGEAVHDLLRGLDLVEWNRISCP